MTQPRPLKDLSTLTKGCPKPWLLIALGLHGVLLFLPLPSESPSEPTSTAENIQIVSLPSPTPSTAPTPPPTPPLAVPPPPTPSVAPSIRVQARPSAPPAITPTSTPSPTPAPAATNSPQPAPSPSPAPNPSPSPSPSPTPTPTPSVDPNASTTVLSTLPNPPDFPHAEGSQPGCGGQAVCWQTDNTQWRSVARTFEQTLEDQGYDVNQLELETDTGVRVYAVSKEGEIPYYLNLLSTLDGTVYVLSDKPLTPQELTEMAAAQG